VIVKTDLLCVECGAIADEKAKGWRMCRTNAPDLNEQPDLAAYCPKCAAREFD
jgi:hypothetical protein